MDAQRNRTNVFRSVQHDKHEPLKRTIYNSIKHATRTRQIHVVIHWTRHVTTHVTLYYTYRLRHVQTPLASSLVTTSYGLTSLKTKCDRIQKCTSNDQAICEHACSTDRLIAPQHHADVMSCSLIYCLTIDSSTWFTFKNTMNIVDKKFDWFPNGLNSLCANLSSFNSRYLYRCSSNTATLHIQRR